MGQRILVVEDEPRILNLVGEILDEEGYDVTRAANLEAAATALGPTYNIAPAAYIAFQPTRFLRPFDLGRD